MPDIQELLELAAQRAAMEVETWIPEKIGDRIAGEVIELGTISTTYGDYYTTTLTVMGDYVENGEVKDGTGKAIRVAWMGAVLKAQFIRMQPRPTDISAFHYQKNITPKSGMNDYALIVAAVIDPTTGYAKIPVMPEIHIPTTEQIANADPRTGELAPAGVAPFVPEDVDPGWAKDATDTAETKVKK